MFSVRFLLTTLVVTLSFVACSGASSPHIGQSTTEDSSPTESSGGSGSSSQEGDPSGTGEASPATPEANPPQSPQPPNGNDNNDNKQPPPTCTIEIEPNGTSAQATTFTSCVAGALANTSDADVLRITTPATPPIGTMTIEHAETHGKITYRVSRDLGGGVLIDIGTFTDGSPHYPVIAGSDYVFRLAVPASEAGKNEKPAERGYLLHVTFH